VLDLYAGAGLFTAVLADAVGETGMVIGVESSRQAVSDAQENLADLAQATVIEARIDPDLIHQLGLHPDLVVLDPPRAGAGPDVMAALVRLAPRVIVYVACDPASLARDIANAMHHGWRLAGLRAFDAFPMTAHVECVAVLESTDSLG
jgi:tRNA/tmRNA/rRNA uracil-C5-methylase (TrmA/RlmC/RlmD family)